MSSKYVYNVLEQIDAKRHNTTGEILAYYHICKTVHAESYEKWRVRKSRELQEKSGELRIATPTFCNSPLIFKLMNGELQYKKC